MGSLQLPPPGTSCQAWGQGKKGRGTCGRSRAPQERGGLLGVGWGWVVGRGDGLPPEGSVPPSPAAISLGTVGTQISLGSFLVWSGLAWLERHCMKTQASDPRHVV